MVSVEWDQGADQTVAGTAQTIPSVKPAEPMPSVRLKLRPSSDRHRLSRMLHSMTATASISSRYSGKARPATTTRVLAGGGLLPRYLLRTSRSASR
jgi:hypothetical protein